MVYNAKLYSLQLTVIISNYLIKMKNNILKDLHSWKPIFLVCLFFCSLSKTFANNETSFGIQTSITITGTVTSQTDGQPMPGASVMVKGTSQGTTTDFDGNYSITVDSKETVLVFSYVSFKSQEITVGNQTEINVSLEEDTAQLDEVVVVAFGTQKKETLTGAVETVKAEVFEDRAVTSPALALQGQTPGLVVTRSSSRPGNEGIGFNIRGATSVNGGTPLIVIDGTPAVNNEAFYNMNSDDIASITVLKDASAAIYGSRAANGVILVTTKKGKQGKMVIDFTSTFRANTLGIRPPTPTMQQYATVWLEAADQDGDQANYWGWQSRENLELMQSGYEGIYSTQYWGNVYIGNSPRYDEMFGTSYSNQQYGSISGASEKTTYRLSFGYAEDIGALKTAYDGKQQYNVRLNNDFTVTDWLKLETGVSYLKYHVSSPSSGLDAASVATDPPFFPSRNPYGQWYANFNIAGNRNAVAATVDGGRENTKRDQIKLNFALSADLLEGLTFKLTGVYNKDFYNYQMYQLTVPQYSWYGELAPESVNPTSSIRERSRNVLYQNYGGFLNYQKNFGDHHITAMAAITAEKNEDKNLYGYRRGFEDYGVYDLNLGSVENLVEATGGAGHWGLYSYLTRFTYDYQTKYLLELTGRRDGSSKFSKDNRWSNFGSVQAGWVISNEKFFESIKHISFLKLRGSYGEMGNQVGIGNYDYISGIGFGNAVFGYDAAYQTSAYVNGLTSRNRTWERVKDLTVGVDFSLFDSKLSGSYSYFNKKNDGMFIEVNYPDVLGGTAPKSNDGILKSKGWELSLNWNDTIGEDFRYSIGANMSDARNKIVSMKNATVITSGLTAGSSSNPHVESYPVGAYFLYETDGFFQSQEEVDAYYAAYGGKGNLASLNTDQTRLRPGDTKIVDRDGNGTIDADDLKFMGDSAPHYVYGLNLGANYKNFDFTAFFQGVMDQNVLRTGYTAFPFYTLYTNQTTSYIGKTWTEENPDAAYPRMTSNTTRARWNWQYNDFALQNNRYIRLKSLVVGYTLRDVKISSFTLNKLRFYFTGNDLFEFTSIKDGYDPEFGESSNSIYPYNRTYALGVNVSF